MKIAAPQLTVDARRSFILASESDCVMYFHIQIDLHIRSIQSERVKGRWGQQYRLWVHCCSVQTEAMGGLKINHQCKGQDGICIIQCFRYWLVIVLNHVACL